MLAPPNGQPPFRADHVDSLRRPPALRQAFRDHQARRIDDEQFAELSEQDVYQCLGGLYDGFRFPDDARKTL